MTSVSSSHYANLPKGTFLTAPHPNAVDVFPFMRLALSVRYSLRAGAYSSDMCLVGFI
jgi:hypothetical protein